MHILPELDAIITQWPDLAEAYFFRGEIYLSSKKFDEALADFNRAIELMPNELQFRSWQCNIYAYHLKRLDEALDGANYILERDPTYVAALMVRAAISFHIGNKQQAATDWEEVLKLCPNDPEARQIRKLIKKASS
jgi:tetratricopeptide (TPR) repeat protein